MPRRGDFVRLVLDPPTGREQAGERPALVLSDEDFNTVTGRAVIVPVASRVRGWPFEVALPDDGRVRGAVQSDQVRSVDWAARHARFICVAQAGVMEATVERVALILGLAQSPRTLS